MSDPQTPQTGSAEDRAVDALIGVINSSNNPDLWEAQAILLRRLALQGDVVPSRVPAPRNISEIGGYLNLLQTLHQPEMRAQMLAGILGVAGPAPGLTLGGGRPTLAMVALPNDRPEGVAQPSIPLTVAARSDFAAAIAGAKKALHDRGATLPLLGALPPLPGPLALPSPLLDDALPFLGRTLEIVPGTALVDPTEDPIALARTTGTTGAFQIVARVFSVGPVTVTPASWDALTCTATACTPTTLSSALFVPVAPILADAGFYPKAPLPAPQNQASTTWTRFTNVTGLVAGRTQLGDELALLYSGTDLAASAFAPRLHWIWNGTRFAAP